MIGTANLLDFRPTEKRRDLENVFERWKRDVSDILPPVFANQETSGAMEKKAQNLSTHMPKQVLLTKTAKPAFYLATESTASLV